MSASRAASPSTRPPTRRVRSPRCATTSQRQADGPAGRRRCRLWQDRGGTARCGARGARRPPGDRRRADHGAGPPAPRQASPSASPATGIKVAGLSRLSSAAEKKAVKAGLADGSIQIVIGTGAVMAKDVRYRDLGLVVIDEEQRFGAADKERLRGTGERPSAEPERDADPAHAADGADRPAAVSVIATPPARRQPIRTSLDDFDASRAHRRCCARKAAADRASSSCRGSRTWRRWPKARRIVPDLALVEAHGKMPAAEIDAAMVNVRRRATAISCWPPTSSRPGSTCRAPTR
jgi:hypothetical protein